MSNSSILNTVPSICSWRNTSCYSSSSSRLYCSIRKFYSIYTRSTSDMNFAVGLVVPMPTLPPDTINWLVPTIRPLDGRFRTPVIVSPVLLTLVVSVGICHVATVEDVAVRTCPGLGAAAVDTSIVLLNSLTL